ncbi:tyrosine-protein phosphatase [Gordonia amicalis]|uniref:tyrosine-protein phosphatase n=1 Tax=Gordonia amicalis TaxID=89053 RepID=UPI00040ACCB0|nr:tyrosine-protein phosphatase [Gordonia amicalis]
MGNVPVPTIVLDGVANFRSLSGLPATDGRRVRDGVLYRTESLAGLTDLGRKQLAELHIGSICDLRSPGEVERAPIVWPEGQRPWAIPVATLPDARVAGAELIRRVLADTTGEYIQEVLLGNAKQMPGAFGESMRGVFDSLEDPQRRPLLVSCVAGKDRTGFVTAVILATLGVEWDAIVGDYLLSKEFFTADRLYDSMVVWLDELPDPIITPEKLHENSALPEYLEASFDAIRDEFGGFDEFLAGPCGMDARRRDRLKDLLLE